MVLRRTKKGLGNDDLGYHVLIGDVQPLRPSPVISNVGFPRRSSLLVSSLNHETRSLLRQNGFLAAFDLQMAFTALDRVNIFRVNPSRMATKSRDYISEVPLS